MPAKSPKIQKSSRHSKITGDFAESLVLYFLSKHGFECAKVDHTGIDLIAKHPKQKKRIGLSVKSRSREEGGETAHLGIDTNNLKKCRAACRAFGCVPYFAVVVDAVDKVEAFIAPEDRFHKYAKTSGRTTLSWKMRPVWKKKYAADPRVMRFEMSYTISRWWK